MEVVVTSDGQRELLVATSEEVRAVERVAGVRDYNRRLSPATLALLDPEGSHIVSPWMVHRHAQGEEVDPHMRCRVMLKLIGRDEAAETMIDVGMELLPDKFPPPVVADDAVQRVVQQQLEDLVEERAEFLAEKGLVSKTIRNDGKVGYYVTEEQANNGELLKELMSLEPPEDAG